ncbi:MAG TPA: hypothetical protein VK465_05480, partial [Fibrobacteria bacterium]|nr:hypothetical protein [Fibrobacteria bacterium]
MRKPRKQGKTKSPAKSATAAARKAAAPESAAPATAVPGTTVLKSAVPKDDTGSDWAPVPPSRGMTAPEDAWPSMGSDKRGLDRISQRELGKVDFDLRTPGGGWVKARLWDFSSIGFGVLLEPRHAGRDPILAENGEASGASPPLSEGDEVRIRIRVRAHASFEAWCSVIYVSPWRGAFKVGLRRQDVGLPQEVGGDRRATPRLSFSPALGLAARVRNPFLYGHWSVLRVTDVGRNLGFAFVTDDPSTLLFEGMEVRIHFDLACFRSMPILARVTWAYATQKSELRFGVECLSMDWRLQAGLWDYLLHSGQWTPATLREAGFRGSRVKGRLCFRTVKTMEDYAEVLKLRRDAYVGAGERLESTQPEDMASSLDGISRILIARHHGLLVGSVTLAFPASEDTLLDSQEGFPGGKYPVAIPPKANLIEMNSLCIREDYRGTDLPRGLFEHGLKHVLMSDRHWLITSATEEL